MWLFKAGCVQQSLFCKTEKILAVLSISVLNESEIKFVFSPKENSLLGSLGFSSGFPKFTSNFEMVSFFFFLNFWWWRPKLWNGVIRNGYLCVPSIKQDETCSVAWCRLETANTGMTFSSHPSWVSVEMCFCFPLPCLEKLGPVYWGHLFVPT